MILYRNMYYEAKKFTYQRRILLYASALLFIIVILVSSIYIKNCYEERLAYVEHYRKFPNDLASIPSSSNLWVDQVKHTVVIIEAKIKESNDTLRRLREALDVMFKDEIKLIKEQENVSWNMQKDEQNQENISETLEKNYK